MDILTGVRQQLISLGSAFSWVIRDTGCFLESPWPFVCFLWRIMYPDLLLTFLIMLFVSQAEQALFVFCKVSPCQVGSW